MCFIRITIAYLCQKIIDFDAVDLNERCSEEVMFLLTLCTLCILEYRWLTHW